MKKPETTATTKKEIEAGKIESYEVTRARCINSANGQVIFFTLVLNKGNDGKYYSHVFFRFSEEDEKRILEEVERQINE